MSGSYDIYNYLDKGYYDDNVYFNNPAMYLPKLSDDYHLPRLQKAALHVITGGDHSFKVPGGVKAQQPAFDEAINAAAAWIRSVAR